MRGDLVVRRGNTTVPLRPKERAVLAAIALAHPQPIGVDRIVDLVWPDHAPATARKTVQNHIARVRRSIDDLVETSDLGYRFASDVIIDRVSAGGRDLPLADLPDTPEIEAHRQRIHAHVVAAEEQQWERQLADGADPELLAALHAGVRAEPYRERRWLLLASAHSALGARRDALQACSQARQRLADVGLVPGEALLAVEQRLLADEPTAPRAAPVAPVVHPHRPEPFVGRSFELTRVTDSWNGVSTLRIPHAVVVEGPAGAGKTRLVDEFCRSLPDGTSVLVARHRPDGDQALAPMTAAFRPVLDVPAAPVGEGPGTPTGAVAENIRSTLQYLGDRPHVVVLDDAQWASSDAIDVLRDAIDGLGTPTLLLLTTRPSNDGGDTWLPLAAVVPVRHITIGELSRAELVELVAAACLDDAPDVDLVYTRTAGLPFYASELLRVARLTGRLDVAEVPPAVRTWMQQRLGSLDASAAEVIRTAAVAGPAVDGDLIARSTGRTLSEVFACCDRLVDAGLLTADADGTIRFGHELTRDAVAGSLGPAALAGLHRRLADALEAGATDLEPALLAYHLARGGPSVSARAAAASTRAGDRELTSGAWHQAESWFRTALALAGTDDARARALAGLGRALVGRECFDESAAVLRAAIDLARELGLDDVQARATLSLAGRAGRGAGVSADDAEITSLLRSALDHLDRAAVQHPSDRERHVLTSAIERELAIMLLLDDAADERVQLLDRQLARSRALDPPDAGELASALLASRYAHLDGSGLRRRLADVEEVLTLPAVRVGPERLLTAHCYRHEDLMRSGDRGRAAAALTDAEGLVRRYPHPYWNWVARTWRAIEQVNAGDLDAAERLAVDAAALRSGIDEAAACLGVNLVNIRLFQGRGAEVLPLLRNAVATYPHIPTYRAVLALCSAEAGDLDAADDHLRHFAGDALRDLPHDTNRMLALAVLSHTAAVLEAVDVAPLLRKELTPFTGQWVVLNCYGGGGAVWGPVDHALALLALLERDPLADIWFERAATQAAGAPLVLERIGADRGATRRRRRANRAAS